MKKLCLMQREVCVSAALAASLVLCGMLSGCRSSRETVETSQLTEEHHSSITISTAVPDTIVYALAPQYEERVVRDSVSVITNDYAQSRIEIHPDGTMMHSLDSRDRVVYVPVQKVTTVTDTVRVNTAGSSTQSRPVAKQNKTRVSLILLLLAAVAVVVLLVRRKN